MTARPQDHLPKKVVEATQMQAANITQKAILDNVVVKIARIQGIIRDLNARAPKVLRGHAADYAEGVAEIERTLRLTRDEVAEIRFQPEFTFPDERVQAIITEAVDKITAAILDEEA